MTMTAAEAAAPDLRELSRTELDRFRAEAERLADEADGLADVPKGPPEEEAELSALRRLARARGAIQRSRAATAAKEQERRAAADREHLNDLARQIAERPSDAEQIVAQIKAVVEAFAELRRIADRRKAFVQRTGAVLNAGGVRTSGPTMSPETRTPVLWHKPAGSGQAVGYGLHRVEPINVETYFAAAVRWAFGTSMPDTFTVPRPSEAVLDASDFDKLVDALRSEMGEK